MELVASLVSLLGPGRHVMIPPSSVFSNKNDFSILAFAFSDMFLLSFVKGVQRAGQYIYSCVGVTFFFWSLENIFKRIFDQPTKMQRI